ANSDADVYGGSGVGNLGAVDTDDISSHGHPRSLAMALPPLGIVMLEAPSCAPAPAGGV
ncbi:MAG: alpha amylase C-terminal domain-containing protein, partial [Acidimicrobiia bacterium]|nr:alpha amylase C-terminal domain-containing protein [Acidimicrobiia bacterium]